MVVAELAAIELATPALAGSPETVGLHKKELIRLLGQPSRSVASFALPSQQKAAGNDPPRSLPEPGYPRQPPEIIRD